MRWWMRSAAILLAISIDWAGAKAAPTEALWRQLEAASWQLWQRSLGGLTAICSAGAFWTDGARTRLLTAGHCVLDHRERDYTVSQDGLTFYRAEVIAVGFEWNEQLRRYDERSGSDWAVLEIRAVVPTLSLPRQDVPIPIGTPLYSVGYPIGGDRFGASGVVANPAYRIPGSQWDGYLAAQLFSLPGSSGSVVVTEDGQIVGIVVAGARDSSQLTILTPVRLLDRKRAIPEASTASGT